MGGSHRRGRRSGHGLLFTFALAGLLASCVGCGFPGPLSPVAPGVEYASVEASCVEVAVSRSSDERGRVPSGWPVLELRAVNHCWEPVGFDLTRLGVIAEVEGRWLRLPPHDPRAEIRGGVLDGRMAMRERLAFAAPPTHRGSEPLCVSLDQVSTGMPEEWLCLRARGSAAASRGPITSTAVDPLPSEGSRRSCEIDWDSAEVTCTGE